MNPEISPNPSRDNAGRTFGRKLIPRFTEGTEGPQISSARDMNGLVDGINCALSLRIEEGDKLEAIVTDANILIKVPPQQQLSPVSAPAGASILGNTPLDSAIFVPAHDGLSDLIYGARGGVLFEFSTAGNVTRSVRFASPYMGESFLCLDSSNTIWASYYSDFGGSERQPSRGFYKILPSTVALLVNQFIPFEPPYSVSTPPVYSLGNLTLHTAPSHPFGVWTFDYPVGPSYFTPFNVGAAQGDAFYYAANAPVSPYNWVGTWVPSVTTDVYIAQVVAPGTPGNSFWWALGHQASPSDTPVNLSTVLTGRGNPIVTVPAGTAFSVYAPLGSPSLWEAVFGFTGTVTATGSLVGFLGNYVQNGPRRLQFGSNGHLFCSYLDSAKTSGAGGFSPQYTGTTGGTMFELDMSGATPAIVNTCGTGSDVNGNPGVNAFWLDVAGNDIWIGNDMGLSQCTGGAVGGFFECFITSTPWFDIAIYGADYVPGNGLFYMVTASSVICTCPKAHPDNAHVARFTVPNRPGMQPRNIRLVPWRGSIGTLFLATMQDNAVLEIDPASNTVVNVFTGFDCPWDTLDTGSTVLAIQRGLVGLKRIV